MKKHASLWRFWSGEALSGGTGEEDPEALGRRVLHLSLILIGGGFLLCLLLGRWRWALGYGIGGGIGLANLELLRLGVTRALSSGSTRLPSTLLKGSLLRLLGVGIVLFVVLKFLPVHVIALALGLLVVQVAMVMAGARWGSGGSGGA
jgi:hypothetical protein